jgi:phospholipid/cholesterol/gamma-HCH transport system substrate-binding protein
MKGRFRLELAVGVFVIIGVLCLAYLSIRLGKMEVMGKGGYKVYAIFSDVGGLRVGAPVVIAGVEVGSVENVRLEDYEARVLMRIQNGLSIHEDAIVSVRTRGLIGEKFIQITEGAAQGIVAPGGQLRQTESAVDLEQLISKYAFGKI